MQWKTKFLKKYHSKKNKKTPERISTSPEKSQDSWFAIILIGAIKVDLDAAKPSQAPDPTLPMLCCK